MEKSCGRIAFLLSNMSTGGAERVVSNLSLILSDQWDVDIILNDTDNICFPYGGNLVSLGIERPETLMTYGYQMKVLLKRLYCLINWKSRSKYEAYISFMDSSNLANLLTGSKNGKVIVSIRNNIDEHSKRKVYRYFVKPLLNILYRRADYIVTVSHEIRQQVMETFRVNEDKVVTILNGYDREQIQLMSEEPLTKEECKWISDGFLIVTMGRLSDQKAQWHLIRAFTVFHMQHKDSRLLILGEGELEEYLRELIEESGIGQHVILCGARKNPFRIIKHADLFVFPSLFEGFPNALAEAMCCGLPCIASDFVSGARELLAEKNGLRRTIKGVTLEKYGVLIPVCDGVKYKAKQPLTVEEQILLESMERFAEDPQLCIKYRKASMERIIELDIKNIAEKWRNLIGSRP